VNADEPEHVVSFKATPVEPEAAQAADEPAEAHSEEAQPHDEGAPAHTQAAEAHAELADAEPVQAHDEGADAPAETHAEPTQVHTEPEPAAPVDQEHEVEELEKADAADATSAEEPTPAHSVESVHPTDTAEEPETAPAEPIDETPGHAEQAAESTPAHVEDDAFPAAAHAEPAAAPEPEGIDTPTLHEEPTTTDAEHATPAAAALHDEAAPEPEAEAFQPTEIAQEHEASEAAEPHAEPEPSAEFQADLLPDDTAPPATLEDLAEPLVALAPEPALTHAEPTETPSAEEKPTLSRFTTTPAASGGDLFRGPEIAAMAAINVVPLINTPSNEPETADAQPSESLINVDTPAAEPTLAAPVPDLAHSFSEAPTLLDDSSWASSAPTPVERDEVVLAPSDFLAAETVAAVDAQKAGQADEVIGSDMPAEEASTEPLEESVSEAEPSAPEPIAEDDDVHRLVHSLDEVRTPALELDAPTPDEEGEPILTLDTLHGAPAIAVSDESGAITPVPNDAPVIEAKQDEAERPSRPWTPSYSVTSQGPNTPGADEPESAAVEEAEAPPAEHEVYCPTSNVESLSLTPTNSRLLRLVPRLRRR
jgi:hypothetical protein